MPYRPIISWPKPLISFVFLLIVLSAGSIYGEDLTRMYDLEVYVGDTTGSSGEQNSAISLYLVNRTDTVAGFNLWIQLSRPDIMEFQTSFDIIPYDIYYIYTAWDPQNPSIPTDSVVASPYWVCNQWNGDLCVDSSQELGYYKCITPNSPPDPCTDYVFVPWTAGIDPVYTELKEAWVGNVDTTNTLSSGWEMITTRSITGTGQDMLITAFADQQGPPPDTRTKGIGYPQYGLKPLIKINGDIFAIDDTVTNRSAKVMINASILDYFGFSDEVGNSIGVESRYVEHYTYFMCEQWLIPDEICFYWNKVMQIECPPEGCDSIHVDTLLRGFLDVDECCDPSGEECIKGLEEWQCASQFGGTGVWHAGSILIHDGSITIERGTCGDINNDGSINIMDVVYVINYKYKGGPEPLYMGMADVNHCDGYINILDVVYLINYKYKSGPLPDCCGK